VNFIRRLRDEVKFEGLEALKAQIHTDIALARDVLAELD
jgi:FAD synthase